MPVSKAEQILDALKALFETLPDAVVERNSVLPEKIPDGGLIILRDGDPGEPEQALGGSGNLLQQIGAALETDLTLSGLAFRSPNGRPEAAIEAIAGAAAIKSATLTVTVDYEAEAPLS
jgi:hypothetical protein